MRLLYLKKAINRILLDRFKPLVVHVEAIFNDEVWEEVKKEVSKGKVRTWYLMTPVNYDYFKAHFNIKQSKKEVARIMKERYLWMKEKRQHLELHIHLSKIMNLSFKEQEKLFRDSMNWLEKEVKIRPKEMAPGWWSYNRDTLFLLKKYGLVLQKKDQAREIHDYNLLKNRPWLHKDWL